MGDLFLTIYVCSYVRTWYVRTYIRTYRNMSRSGMLIGMLRVSCRPIEFYLLRGLDVRCENNNLEKQISGQAHGAPGLAELEQLHMESNSYIRSQTVNICLYRNSTIISRSQRLWYKRAGPSGLAEQEQLHVESNSQCNRHVYLSSTLANSHLARDL